SDTELEVRGVELLGARFETAPGRDADTRIPAGRTTDLPVTLPATDCDGGGEPVGPAGSLTVRLELAGGGEVDVPGRDAAGFLERLHAADCLGEAVSRRAHVEVAELAPSRAGGPAALRIRVAGIESGLTLIALRPTNLLRYATEGTGAHHLDVAVGPGAVLLLDVPLVPQRCDPHALMEDKRGAVFPLEVAVDGAAGTIELVTPVPLAAEILDWVREWCAPSVPPDELPCRNRDSVIL